MHRLVGRLHVLAILCLATSADAGDRFPEWRGVNGQGHANAKNLPVKWSESSNVAWKQKIPGRGWSTPVIANGQVWVTTATHKLASKADAARRRKTSTNSQPLTISESASLRAIGFDLKTGKLLKDVEVLRVKDPQMIHIINTYATPSPILEGDKLYCHYGPSGIACLNIKTGKVLWTNQTLKVKHENGPGSSPILWKNLLIVHCDGIDRQYIIALDTITGKQKWKTTRSGALKSNPQLRKSYATSLVVDVDGKPQVVSPAADWVYGYDPQTGDELWKLRYGVLGFSNAGRPVAGHGLVYVCTGYLKSELLAVRLAEGKPKVAWRIKRQVPNVASPLIVGDELYFVSDNGVATCTDAATGKVHWSKRIGTKIWASPLYADGRIYIPARDGRTTVIAPGKTFRKLAENKLDGRLFATAAAVDGSLVLRTDTALYCIRSAK